MNERNDKAKEGSFDEAGVAEYIKDKAVLNWFRKRVQEHKVPWDEQAQLAAILLSEASQRQADAAVLEELRVRG
jgi:hypothetical protein